MWGCRRWWWLLFRWEGVGEGRGDMLMMPSSASSSGLSAPPPLPVAKPQRSASVSYMLSIGSLSSGRQNKHTQRTVNGSVEEVYGKISNIYYQS